MHNFIRFFVFCGALWPIELSPLILLLLDFVVIFRWTCILVFMYILVIISFIDTLELSTLEFGLVVKDGRIVVFDLARRNANDRGLELVSLGKYFIWPNFKRS